MKGLAPVFFAVLLVLSACSSQVLPVLPASSPGHVGNLLVVQPAAGGEARRLGVFGYMGPLAWSPDGTRLSFQAGSVDRPVVEVVAVADSSVTNLGPGSERVWQPDGQ